jgi:hypothetical protein
MHLSCLIGRHAPLPPAARNQGFRFSRCRCCGHDMVSSGRSWRRVPRGFRVVWRQGARSAAASAAGAKSGQVPVAVQRPRRRLRALGGLLDLLRAAMRVMLWSWRDRIRDLGLWMRALPARPKPPLRLPSA